MPCWTTVLRCSSRSWRRRSAVHRGSASSLRRTLSKRYVVAQFPPCNLDLCKLPLRSCECASSLSDSNTSSTHAEASLLLAGRRAEGLAQILSQSLHASAH